MEMIDHSLIQMVEKCHKLRHLDVNAVLSTPTVDQLCYLQSEGKISKFSLHKLLPVECLSSQYESPWCTHYVCIMLSGLIHHHYRVSGLNATDKTPMYEMPLIYVFRVWRLGQAFSVFGVWAMVFCHWRFVLRSNYSTASDWWEVNSITPIFLYCIRHTGLPAIWAYNTVQYLTLPTDIHSLNIDLHIA